MSHLPNRPRSSAIRESTHGIFLEDSSDMSRLGDGTVDLVVTSPPYPMVGMWDGMFASRNGDIGVALGNDPRAAFELMHVELGRVWAECFRVLKDGGVMCVNVGDATRTDGGDFRLYANHARVVSSCMGIGFSVLPSVIWRKLTNAPSKFMGSGTLPCGAYVTLEHEWILVFRKGARRAFSTEGERAMRRASAFFWEERNRWFSDVWEIAGARQEIRGLRPRERNASFPLEIPFRLVCMYSKFGDVVIDPFMGMGTTSVAAMLLGRNSVGFEVERGLGPAIEGFVGGFGVDVMRRLVRRRLEGHAAFVDGMERSGKAVRYRNANLGCKVVTRQETDMDLVVPERIDGGMSDGGEGLSYRVTYARPFVDGEVNP